MVEARSRVIGVGGLGVAAEIPDVDRWKRVRFERIAKAK